VEFNDKGTFGRRRQCRTVSVLLVNWINLKQSRYRPGQLLRVPGGWGSQISWQSAHEGGKFVTGHPYPRGIILVLISFKVWVNLRGKVRLVGCQLKILMIPPGIETATFRILAQCLNRLRHGWDKRVLIGSDTGNLGPSTDCKVFFLGERNNPDEIYGQILEGKSESRVTKCNSVLPHTPPVGHESFSGIWFGSGGKSNVSSGALESILR